MINDLVWILEQQLSTQVKLLFCVIVVFDGKSLKLSMLSSMLKTNNKNVSILIDKMITGQSITKVGNTIMLPVNKNIYKLHLEEYTPITMSGVPISSTVHKAREKLEQMRAVGFVGEEIMIYKLSLEYDSMVQQYTGKEHVSLPLIPRIAKKGRNWNAFKKTLDLITKNQYNLQVYLKAQFESLSNFDFGVTFPYPNMLYSKWAQENYVKYIKNHIEVGTDYKLLLSEEEVIKETMKASHNLVLQTIESNTDLSESQCLLLVCGNLAPIYLACSKEYLQFVNNTQQEIDIDVLKILTRMKQNKDYYKTVTKIYKEVINDRDHNI